MQLFEWGIVEQSVVVPDISMTHIKKYLILLLACGLATQASSAQERIRRDIPRTTEKELTVSVELSYGSLYIGRGASDKILISDYPQREGDREDLKISYDVSRGTGDLVIRSVDKSKWWSASSGEKVKSTRHWSLEFTDAVPISMNIELGAGEGELNLTGLQITELKISSGASAIRLFCDEPNRVTAELMSFESGVGSFTATDLSNTNFRTLKFEGGVGSYKLDFGGSLRRSGEVDIEVGLGAITVMIPEQTPAQIRHGGSWFSSIDIDDLFRKSRKDRYETSSFNNASERLTIRIESGLGSVKVRAK